MGDEIRSDMGDNVTNAAAGKGNQQTSHSGGGATVHLQANTDTLSNIFYHLSNINTKVEGLDGKMDGHGQRMSALEGRVTSLESGRPIQADAQTRWMIVIIIVLVVLLAWSWSSEARGGAVALLLLVQWIGALTQYLRTF